MLKKKISKTLIATALATLVSLTLIGCGSGDNVSGYNKNRFVTLDDVYKIDGYDYILYYDSVTSIVYMKEKGYGYTGGPLIGQNKLPMTLNEYLDSKK